MRFLYIYVVNYDIWRRGGGEEGVHPIFCSHWYFYINSEELQTELFEVELIINTVSVT